MPRLDTTEPSLRPLGRHFTQQPSVSFSFDSLNLSAKNLWFRFDLVFDLRGAGDELVRVDIENWTVGAEAARVVALRQRPQFESDEPIRPHANLSAA